MPTIEIEVKNKIAKSPEDKIVCGNRDYHIHFLFDDEWAAYNTKTARFAWNGQHEDVIFDGDVCPAPVISGATVCAVGVFAGDLHTTTPALVTCIKSIMCLGGAPSDPLPDVYAQLMEKLNSLNPNTSSDTYPIKRIESLDTENVENLVKLRDLESGIYILYGYFKPFSGSDSTLIIDDGFYMVTRVDEGSHLLSISPLNFRMTCHEILVDETNEKGFTYTSKRINLLDVYDATSGRLTSVLMSDRTTGKKYSLFVDKGKLTMEEV